MGGPLQCLYKGVLCSTSAAYSTACCTKSIWQLQQIAVLYFSVIWDLKYDQHRYTNVNTLHDTMVYLCARIPKYLCKIQQVFVWNTKNTFVDIVLHRNPINKAIRPNVIPRVFVCWNTKVFVWNTKKKYLYKMPKNTCVLKLYYRSQPNQEGNWAKQPAAAGPSKG